LKKENKMNPLEIIENGIVDGNWAMVCRGYEDLTGKIIKTKGISNSPNQLIKQIEELLNDYKKNIILNPVIDIEKCIHTPRKNPPEPSPSMPLATGFSTINKKGYYGNDTKPITDDNVPPEEINKNIEKAAITKERKTKRNPPKKYNIKCSQCEQNFESDRQESKDFGQKCPKCLQDTINGKIIDE